jgi:hypothetical protein
MSDFGAFGLLGLCIGFLWGIGCSLAILYSIFLGGYRRAVRDSLAIEKPRRFQQAIQKIRARQKQEIEKAAKETAQIP